MSWVYVTSPCLTCGVPFCYNPHHVPSYRVKGQREPICSDCMGRINATRQGKGLDPFHVHPDAYEPLPENEL